MYVLVQMLTPDSRARVWGEATTFGMNGLNVRQGERGNNEIALLPIVEPSSSHNRANLLDAFLKDSNEHMLRI